MKALSPSETCNNTKTGQYFFIGKKKSYDSKITEEIKKFTKLLNYKLSRRGFGKVSKDEINIKIPLITS